MTVKAGDRIESKCMRCNDVTGHIIVAEVNGEIVKVQCCACGSTHKYRPIGKLQSSQSSEAAVYRVPAGKSRSSAKPEAPKASPAGERSVSAAAARKMQASEGAWREAIESPSAPEAKAYNINMELRRGDVVNHPTFGMGYVKEVTPPNKAVILFRDGIRNMRCSVPH